MSFNETNDHDKSKIPSDSKVDNIKIEPSIEMYDNNGEDTIEDDIKSEFPYEEDDNLDDEDYEVKNEFKKKPKK